MSQFTIYRSSDVGAPVLSGGTGSLINVLDACLVNGYGSQSAAGWSKAFTSGNGSALAAYKMGTTGTIGYYMWIDDNGPDAGKTKEARIAGYETMTAYNTGVGVFPTANQGVNSKIGEIIRKSSTIDTTARTWIMAADSRTLYFFVLTADLTNVYLGFAFGEFYSYVNPSDSYRCMLIALPAIDSIGSNNGAFDIHSFASSSLNGHYMSRSHTTFGGPVNFGKAGDIAKADQATNTKLAGVIPFPNREDSAIYVAPVLISDPTTSPQAGIRGKMRGFWHFLHPISAINDGDTFSGTGPLAGKTFLLVKGGTGGSAGTLLSVYTIETSNTLDTN